MQKTHQRLGIIITAVNVEHLVLHIRPSIFVWNVVRPVGIRVTSVCEEGRSITARQQMCAVVTEEVVAGAYARCHCACAINYVVLVVVVGVNRLQEGWQAWRQRAWR